MSGLKEFYIDKRSKRQNDSGFHYELCLTKMNGDKDEYPDWIHVIEKSAYNKLESDRDEWKRRAKECQGILNIELEDKIKKLEEEAEALEKAMRKVMASSLAAGLHAKDDFRSDPTAQLKAVHDHAFEVCQAASKALRRYEEFRGEG